jgi:hypothetical protein
MARRPIAAMQNALRQQRRAIAYALVRSSARFV